ncbi:MAG: hypothetical protein K0R57_5548 [Paenibacillaceae bacterium]|jgi:hypothetical protein|nr:hypothetical protein [Paenibacillaceae bacterium]
MTPSRQWVKWGSIGCIVAGLILGAIGTACGGVERIDFIFWD